MRGVGLAPVPGSCGDAAKRLRLQRFWRSKASKTRFQPIDSVHLLKLTIPRFLIARSALSSLPLGQFGLRDACTAAQ
jgi:hypothetical protein